MILITGAKGFLGKYLVGFLKKEGYSVLAASKDKLDVTQKKDFFRLPKKISAVIHLAALIPPLPSENPKFSLADYVKINGLGTLYLLEFCEKRKIKKIVHVSTQAVIGRPKYLPVDESHPLIPENHYGLSKLIGETFCEIYQKKRNFQIISLRLPQIYGAAQGEGFVLSKFIKLAKENEDLPVWGHGRAKRDLLYIKDALLAFKLALNSNASGVFNIGSGKGVSIKELAEVIRKTFSRGKSQIRHNFSRPEEGSDFYFDIAKARKYLGFKPKYDIEKGMKDYYEEEKLQK